MTPDSENDFGNYNCTAVNRIGQESSEFILVQAGERPGRGGKEIGIQPLSGGDGTTVAWAG